MFRTLDDVDVSGKRVLVRVDLNVPVENGRVSDMTRIERVAPTISEVADKGGKVILLSHFGRPKGRDAAQSLKRVAPVIANVLKRPVAFAGNDLPGVMLSTAVRRLINLYAVKPGERAVVLSANQEGDAAGSLLMSAPAISNVAHPS